MPSNFLIGRTTRLSLYQFSTPFLVHLRTTRYQAHDALLDQDDLNEARNWHAKFNETSLPKGQTTYSRSSGPGGQHVNKYTKNQVPDKTIK